MEVDNDLHSGRETDRLFEDDGSGKTWVVNQIRFRRRSEVKHIHTRISPVVRKAAGLSWWLALLEQVAVDPS